MNRQELVIGYDLCRDYSQISYYDTEKMEPTSISLNGQMQIPTVLCFIKKESRWLVGKEALQAAAEGKGDLVRDFTENIAKKPTLVVSGVKVDKKELIYLFVAGTLSAVKELIADSEVGYLTFTTQQVDAAMAEALKYVGFKLNLVGDRLFIQSHRLSFEYYALSQKRDLWTHDVGLFEYTKRGLFYNHLSISWKHHPAAVSIETKNLRQYLNGKELEHPVAPEMDRKFLNAIKEVSTGKMISTYYLVGEGFEQTDKEWWPKVSLKHMGAMKRHVFVGQNMYTEGACYSSYYRGVLKKQPGFLAVNADLSLKNIYMRSIHRNTQQKMVVAAAGTPWYGATTEKVVILGEGNQLIFKIHDVITNFERNAVFTLDGLPDRPKRTTRLLISTSFKSDKICHITVKDLGFGELYPGTKKVWEKEFNIDDVNDVADNILRQSVIETSVPVKAAALDMKLSGVRLYTLEELCWYIHENVYAVTDELFNQKMFDWLDKITGDCAFSRAIQNYQQAQKPLKEIIRLLLNSVDYLTTSEIAFVFNKLNEMENMSPIQKARLIADNYNHYGRPMAALKNYYVVIDLMERELQTEAMKKFKSEIWHNTALAFLKLHNVERACECMERAYFMLKDKSYLRPYIYTLLMAKAQEKVLEVMQQDAVSKTEIDEILAAYQEVEVAAAHSDRSLALAKNLEEDGFAVKFITKEKEKYALV